MNQPSIPVLVDFVESAFFPESGNRAKLRMVHWDHCDFALHYRSRAARVGVYKVACQLRKQGFSLHTALSVLAGKRLNHQPRKGNRNDHVPPR